MADKRFLGPAANSAPYTIDKERLPHWATSVQDVRRDHLYTFSTKPVYSREFPPATRPERQPITSPTIDSGYLSPVSDADDDELEVDLPVATANESSSTLLHDPQPISPPTNFLAEEEELFDDF